MTSAASACLWALPFLATSAICCASTSAAEADAVISSDHVSISFDQATGGISGIRSIDSGKEFIHKRAERPIVWKLKFRSADGAVCEIDNTAAAGPVISAKSGALSIEWAAVDLPGEPGAVSVRLDCSLAAKDDTAYLKLHVDNRSRALGLWETSFPTISPLSESGCADVAISRGVWGQLYRGAAEPVSGEYPSYQMPMQFMLLGEGDAGLYLAAHDKGAAHKHFSLNPGGEFSVTATPENAGVPQKSWGSSYLFAIGVYKGDWATGCKKYRSWATHNAPWTAKGKLSERSDVPEQMKKICAWVVGHDQPSEAVDTATRFADAIGAPVGVHWYRWHQIPFDREYPSYFPTLPDVDKGTAEMKSHGIVVMPYINSRLWDTQEKRYSEALPYVTKDETGKPIAEDYGSGTTLGVMCPTLKFWQDTQFEIARRLVDEVGVNAIYLDQIASAPPRDCFDASHGHPVGAGEWWVDGYRQLLTRIKNYCVSNGRQVGLTSENNAEPFMDNIDAFLIWTPREQNEVPMTTAVYGGYALYFASNRALQHGIRAFSLLQARDMVWGTQLGWDDKSILTAKNASAIRFQSRLARMRSALLDYFVYGELIRSIDFTGQVPDMTATWNTWSGDKPVTLPCAQGAFWKAEDGSVAAILANADTRRRTVQITFDADTLGMPRGSHWSLVQITNAGRKETGEQSGRSFSTSVDLPARDSVAVIIRPTDR